MLLSELKLTKRRLELLKKLKIETVEDLLKHYPIRYESIQILPYDQWKKGDNVCFEGIISADPKIIKLQGNRSMTKFRVISWNQEIEVTLFNRPWLSQFNFGHPITIFGIYGGNNKVTASNYNFHPLEKQVGLKPVYSVNKDMKQSDMIACIAEALKHVDEMPQLIPVDLMEKYRLLDMARAYKWIHHPKDLKHLHAAIRTLKYEEFLLYQCAIQSVQKKVETKEPKVFDQTKIEEKIASFPYELTTDQREALDAVLNDLTSDSVMFRMIQGDVGCGKTIVAELSLYAASLAGYQCAFLAPTEILARQHYENLKKLEIDCELYVSNLPAKEKKRVLETLNEGTCKIVVGTHALFQENVEFKNLGFVVADEQQRFGVMQRRSLIEKGDKTDFLMMSATPIPRTYAHFIYGDIALSSIKTMPPGRKPVLTKYIKGSTMKPVLKKVLKAVEEGRQVYVVCGMIDENPDTNLQAVTKIYDGMCKTLGDTVRIGLLHGKMKAAEKEEVMNQFAAHELDIIVSTTVIEVGIDVPNATMMVIYDAHRFGLSTLHQLRGRVARGKRQGECFLLSSSKDPEAIERLKKLEEMTDGFSISNYDLAKRGPGDILGTRQSGLPSFVLGDFEKDPAIMEVCVKDAREIIERQSDLPLLNYIAEAVKHAKYFD